MYNAIMRGYVNPERFALPLYEEQSQAEKSTCQGDWEFGIGERGREAIGRGW